MGVFFVVEKSLHWVIVDGGTYNTYADGLDLFIDVNLQNAESYSYLDLGNDPLSGDWELRFTWRKKGTELQQLTGPSMLIAASTYPTNWSLANAVSQPPSGEHVAGIDYNFQSLYTAEKEMGGSAQIGSAIQDTTNNTDYYVSLSKTGTTLQIDVYTDSGFSNLLDSTNISMNSTPPTTYRYIIAGAFGRIGNPDVDIQAEIRDLEIFR